MPRRLAKLWQVRHERSYSEATVMARNDINGSILPGHWGRCAQNRYRTAGMGFSHRTTL